MAPRRKTSLSSVKTEAYPLLNREALGSLKALWRASHVDRDGPETEIAACDFWMRLAGLVAQELPAWQEVTAQIADALIARFPRPVAERDWASFAHGLMIATAISGDGRYQRCWPRHRARAGSTWRPGLRHGPFSVGSGAAR